MEIRSCVVCITGGASGLGAATARHLTALGAQVSLFDFDYEKAAQLAQEIGAFPIQCDVSQSDAVQDAFAASAEYWGKPAQIIVNCAGIAPAARIVGRDGKLSTALFRQVIDVNLIGTYNVMSYGIQAMLSAEPQNSGTRGVVINTASVACEDGQIGQSAYAASKGAIAAMCLPAARECARHAIRVMAIAPGLFQTPLMEGLPEETVDKITQNIPYPERLGHPDEFAMLVASIIENDYLNGCVIRLDGATRLPPR